MIYYWKPVRITDDIYIYSGKIYKIITLNSFAHYFGTLLKLSVLSDLESRVTQYKSSHSRQFLYPTNVTGSGICNCSVYYSFNSVYGFFERTDGCIQTLLFRNYPDPDICNLGRFNTNIYDITMDCMNALSDYKSKIEKSTIRLLFCRPIVPFCLDTLSVTDFESIFQYNSYALSMSDYRKAFETIEQSTERLRRLIEKYVLLDFSSVPDISIPEKNFYYTFMWFVGIIVYVLNYDIRGLSQN